MLQYYILNANDYLYHKITEKQNYPFYVENHYAIQLKKIKGYNPTSLCNK